MEIKFGECKICKEKDILHSVLGSYKGRAWAGWICMKCYRELMKKDKNYEIVRC